MNQSKYYTKSKYPDLKDLYKLSFNIECKVFNKSVRKSDYIGEKSPSSLKTYLNEKMCINDSYLHYLMQVWVGDNKVKSTKKAEPFLTLPQYNV